MGFPTKSVSLVVLVTIALTVVIDKVTCDGPLLAYETVFNWKELDYQFESPSVREELVKSGEFIRDNNLITGVKVSGNRVFLSVPRWRKGVPATLVYLPYDPSSPVPANREVTNGPKLIPFPSWAMNKKGNCSALQYIQSMEIDQFDRMWAVDVGRVEWQETADNTCPPKLVLIDLKTNSTIQSYEFPAEVVSRNSSFLNDIVVGCTSKEECWAYITDASDAKVIVFNLQKKQSWFVKHSSMLANPDATIINIQGENYTFNTNVDGIALSPLDTNFNTLFFTPLSSYDLYSVPTEVLQKAGDLSNGTGGLELEETSVRHVGVKSSQTDGMTIDASGLLFFGLLGTSAINSWNTSYTNLTDRNQAQLVQNDIDLQWPDTFGIDDKGYVFVTTNRIHRFSTNTYDWESINFRVIRFFVGIKSYMHSKSDMVEPNPVAEPEPQALAEPEPEAEAEPTGTPEPGPEPEPTVQMDTGSESETTVMPSAAAEPEPEPEVEPEAEAEPTTNGTTDGVIKPSDKHKYHHINDTENEILPSQSQVHSGAFLVNSLAAFVIPLSLFLTTLV